MNYGYNKNCKGWKENCKITLAFQLSSALKIGIGNNSNDGVSPYIEVNGAYGGVRIRRITHLSDKAHEELVKKADKVYDEVMRIELDKKVNEEFKKILVRSHSLGFT